MAFQLEPTSRSYAIDLECTLLNNNRASSSRGAAQQTSLEEKAASALDLNEEEERWRKESQEDSANVEEYDRQRFGSGDGCCGLRTGPITGRASRGV
jgi:hypothetical protein